jgi:UDP-N-acetylglucosamine pyrophosphorylase
MDISALKQKLVAIGQGHVLQFFDRLSEVGKKKLISQIEALDLDNLEDLVESQVKQKAAKLKAEWTKGAATYAESRGAKRG